MANKKGALFCFIHLKETRVHNEKEKQKSLQFHRQTAA